MNISIRNGLVVLFLFVVFLFFVFFYPIGKNSSVDCEEIKDVRKNAEEWLFNNIREKGLFIYSYNPKTGELPNQNNAVRQLMASILLAKSANYGWELIQKHKTNIDFVFKWWYKESDDNKYGYIYYDEKSKLGANAMFLRTIVSSPYFNNYEEEARRLADGIISLINQDGGFDPWFIEPNYEYDKDYLLTFYSGEAIIALLEYFEKTEDQKYFKYAEKIQDYYIKKYVDELEVNYYPAYVPWHTISLSMFFDLTGDKKYTDAIFVLNDKLLELLDREDFIGRFYNPKTPQYGSPHSSSDAVYTEGLAYAYGIAKKIDDRKRKKEYGRALNIAFKNLQSLQYKGDEFEDVESIKYKGAIRTKENSNWTRIDTTQHTIDALNKMYKVFCEN